jgi:predicted metal-dependent phosphoesterase TrpH
MNSPLRVDLHLHTRGSWDSLSDPARILARAANLGIGRIAITDHDRLGVALEFAGRSPDRVIPGEEVRTAEGIDVIGLYLSEEIPRGTPALECCRRIREQGGISLLPHPYAGGKGGGGKFAELLAPEVDIVEVFNARLLSAESNRRAEELARRHGRLRSAGSDAHTVGEIGNAWVELPWHENTPIALLAALADGQPFGSRAGFHVFLGSNWAKIRKRLPFPPEKSVRTP